MAPHTHLDVVVLQLHHLPILGLGGGGVSFEGVVRIEPGITNEDGNGVRFGEWVGLESTRLLGNAGGPSSLDVLGGLYGLCGLGGLGGLPFDGGRRKESGGNDEPGENPTDRGRDG